MSLRSAPTVARKTNSKPGSLRNIAVIPARGGSRRISNKNIRLFAGRPLIEYAIALAHSSGLFERVIVSTDSADIRDVAETADAEVPFMRPAGLADDHATTAAVLHHALAAIDAERKYDFACCIYPATPFTTIEDLVEGWALVADNGAPTSLAVTRFAAPIWRAFERRADQTISMVWPEHRDTRSQDLPETFHDAGQFYWVSVPAFMEDPVLISARSGGVVYERWRAHDIDTEEDWVRAELIFRSIEKDRT